MRVLGIDPGLHIVGYGLLEFSPKKTVTLVEAGVIRTAKAKNIENKLKIIYQEIKKIIQEYHPQRIAVEDLFSIYKHPRPAILMGHARGVIFLAAAEYKIEVASYTPTKIKKSLTGNGHATKEQMQRMVKNILGLKQIPKPPDVADAIATSLCHIERIKKENL